LELGAIEEAYDSSPEVLNSMLLGVIDFVESPEEPNILSLAESLIGDPPELQPISDSEYESSEMDGLDLGDWYEHMLAACESVNAFASDLLEATDEEQIELNRVQVDRNKYPTLQRNAAQVKGKARILPKPLIVTVNINGHLAQALLDSSSLGDFMSAHFADQLKLENEKLELPLMVQLAVQGLHSRVNSRVCVHFQYQGIDEEQMFDIININSYDLILGTPWLYQHQAYIGLNPGHVVIGSDKSIPIRLGSGTKLMAKAISIGGGAKASCPGMACELKGEPDRCSVTRGRGGGQARRA